MNNKMIISRLNATIADAKKEIYSDILNESNKEASVSSDLDWLKNRFKQHGLDNKVRNESKGVSEEEWNRKVDAFYNFWPKVKEMFAKYGAATDKDYKWSPQREWCIDLSKYLDIMCSFNHMSDSFQIHYAVAYWIMESILKQVKIDEMEEIISDVPSLISGNSISHSIFKNEQVGKVLYIIKHRNDDCITSNKRISETYFEDTVTALNNNHQDVPSRRRFEELLSLVDKEDLNNALTNTKALIWQYTELAVKEICEYYSRFTVDAKEHDKATKAFIKALEKQVAVFKGGMKNNVLAMPVDPELEKEMVALETDKCFERKENVDNRMSDDLEAFLERFKELPANLFKSKDLTLPDPFEFTFSIFYLLDSGDDLPWYVWAVYPLSLEVMFHIPWGINADHYNKTIKPPVTSHKYDVTEFYSVSGTESKERIHPLNAIQLLYSMTGYKFLLYQKHFDEVFEICKRFGLEDEPARYLALTVNVAKELNFQFKLNEEEDVKDDELNVDELRNTLIDLRRTLRSYRSSQHDSDKKISDLTAENEILESQNKEYLSELAQLREIVFQTNNQIDVKEEEISLSFPYKTNLRVVIYGGHPQWETNMKALLKGDVYYGGTTNPNVDVIRSADVIVIQTNYISHSAYYEICDIARINKIPILYFNWAGAKRCIKVLSDFEKK